MEWESVIMLLPVMLVAAAPPAAVAQHDLALGAAAVIARAAPFYWTDFQIGVTCGESDPGAPECLTAPPPA